MVIIFYLCNFGKLEMIGSGQRFHKRSVYPSVWNSCFCRNLHRKPGSELIHSFVNSWIWENMLRSFALNRPHFPLCTSFLHSKWIILEKEAGTWWGTFYVHLRFYGFEKRCEVFRPVFQLKYMVLKTLQISIILKHSPCRCWLASEIRYFLFFSLPGWMIPDILLAAPE